MATTIASFRVVNQRCHGNPILICPRCWEGGGGEGQRRRVGEVRERETGAQVPPPSHLPSPLQSALSPETGPIWLK